MGQRNCSSLSCRPVSLQPYQSLSNHSIQEIRKRFIKSIIFQCRVFLSFLVQVIWKDKAISKSHFSPEWSFFMHQHPLSCAKFSIFSPAIACRSRVRMKLLLRTGLFAQNITFQYGVFLLTSVLPFFCCWKLSKKNTAD